MCLLFQISPQMLSFLIRNVACQFLEREEQKRSRLGPWLGRSETNGNQGLSCKRRGETNRLPCRRLAAEYAPATRWYVSARVECRIAFLCHLSPHDVAVVALLRSTTTSSYCFCVSNPSVMLLLSSNLGNTTAM